MILSGRGQARLRRALRELGGKWYAEGRGPARAATGVFHDLAHWQDFGWALFTAPGGRDMGERIGDHLWGMTHHDRLHAEYRACAITLLAAHEVVGDSTNVPPHWGAILSSASLVNVTAAEVVQGIANARDLTSTRLSAEALTAHLRRMAAPTRGR